MPQPMLASTFTPVYVSPQRGRIQILLWTIVFFLALGGLMALRRTGLFIPTILMMMLWLAAIFGIIMGIRYAFWAPLLYRVSEREIEVYYDAKRNGFVPQPLLLPRAAIAKIERREKWVRLEIVPGSQIEIERFNRRKDAGDGALYLPDEGLFEALHP